MYHKIKYSLQPKMKSHLILSNFDSTRNSRGIPAKLANIFTEFSKTLSRQNIEKNWQNLKLAKQLLQQFLTNILRLENGAKECIV